MKHSWKITRDRKLVSSGEIEAANEREALGLVLLEQGEGKDPDACYTVSVGGVTTTSFGDEFERSAEVVSWDDEVEPMGDRPLETATTSPEECVQEIAKAIAKKVIRDAVESIGGKAPSGGIAKGGLVNPGPAWPTARVAAPGPNLQQLPKIESIYNFDEPADPLFDSFIDAGRAGSRIIDKVFPPYEDEAGPAWPYIPPPREF